MRPLNVKITRVKEEAKEIKTFFFNTRLGSAVPGQYIMVWIRGVDEVPMSLSYENAFTVKKIGDATSALFKYKKGDTIAIRGPFGHPFKSNGRKVAIIAGGIGAAPLAFLAEYIARQGIKTSVFLGARCKEEILFTSRFKKLGELRISTDDGSLGFRGMVTDLVDGAVLKGFNQIYTCGPEQMMYKVLGVCSRLGIAKKLQLSVERYLKCGLGLCGSCDLGGFRVCVDGPVFRGDELLQTEFGKYKRDGSGRRIEILE